MNLSTMKGWILGALLLAALGGSNASAQTWGTHHGVGYSQGYHAPCSTCATGGGYSGCGWEWGCCPDQPRWTHQVWNNYPYERQRWYSAGYRSVCRHGR